jgi:uncharacterized protein (TIGR01244 family)
MLIHRLTEQLSVAAQIDVEDIATLAAQGFRSIINNRPDGESQGQPSSAALEAATHRAGLAYRYIPSLAPPRETAQVEAFATALREMPGPVLAFCRSGTRSCMLWALQADAAADAVLATARTAGYELSSLRPYLKSGDRG